MNLHAALITTNIIKKEMKNVKILLFNKLQQNNSKHQKFRQFIKYLRETI